MCTCDNEVHEGPGRAAWQTFEGWVCTCDSGVCEGQGEQELPQVGAPLEGHKVHRPLHILEVPHQQVQRLLRVPHAPQDEHLRAAQPEQGMLV